MATILIVDDFSANRNVLVRLLRSQGHRLLEAADGREGLAAVHAEHPHLVITDVLMPIMDGYELARRLRLDPRTSGTPVVFYTAYYGEREARALALSSGVYYVLTKPSEAAEVLKIVGRALSGESQTAMPADASPRTAEFDREHLPLLTDHLSDKAADLRIANARLRALVNIGLELASERDPDRLIQRVCMAARDLFSASYVTLGILDPSGRTVQRFLTCGASAADWIKAGDGVPGILGTVVAGRRTWRGDNPGGDPARLQLPLLHPEVQAFLAAPLASPAHVYGWICLVGNEGRAFTEDDEHLVIALSGQIGRIYELEHEILERKQAESAARHARDRAQGYLDTAEVLLLERTQAVEALRTAEERVRFALEAASVGIWDTDYTTGVTRWSEILEAHYGLQPGTFVGTFKAFIERVHPDDRESVLETLGTAMRSGADFSVVHRTIWPDGTVRWLRGAGRVHFGEHGEPVRVVGISQDVTERKRAEATLGQSETRNAAILDSVLDCIVTMDANGMVIEFNAAAERTFGYTKAEAIGRALDDLIIPPSLRDAHRAGLAHYLATGEGPVLGKLLEITALRSDGAEIPMELAITAIRSEKAPIFTGVLRNITARKQADETRARLAAIVESSDDAIFATALDDTVLTWNAGAERLYGYSASEMIGRTRATLVPVGRGAELTAILEKAVRGVPVEPFETQRTRKDGSIIDVSLRISPITGPAQRVIGTSTVARDIRSRKKAEAELTRLNDEIQLQRLRVFRATIRTVQDIVNNLLTSFQLIRDEAEAQLPAEMLTLVDQMIQEAAVKLKALGDLETVNEKEMAVGLGIDYPGSAS